MRCLLVLLGVSILAGQDLDTVVDKKNRKVASVLDQVERAAERELYLKIYRETTPLVRRSLAAEFLREYPDSWLLAQVLEAASKAAMEMNDLPAAIYYGKQSLRLYPENPLLLAPMAILQAKRGERKAAVANAEAVLDYLDRFAAPAGMPDKQWNPVRDSLRESALQIVGEERRVISSARRRADPQQAYAGSAACQR